LLRLVRGSSGIPWGGASLLLLLGVVCGLTAVAGGGGNGLAASPERIAQGKVWLLISSGLVAEHPVAASLVSFAILAGLTHAVCGGRIFWSAALAGHVGSTVVVYLFIGVARSLAAGAFQTSLWSPDYGVSAISAAWLGAIASTGWRARGQTPYGRVAIAVSCVAVAVFAYMLRPGFSVLASEHLVAFAIGVGAATVIPAPRGRFEETARGGATSVLTALSRAGSGRQWLPRLDPFALGALVVTAVLLGGSMMPTALAGLRRAISDPEVVTAEDCGEAWNRLPTQVRSLLRSSPALVVAVHANASTSAGPRGTDTCAFLLPRRGHELAITGTWRRGRLGSLRYTAAGAGIDELPTNASTDLNGRLSLNTTTRTNSRKGQRSGPF